MPSSSYFYLYTENLSLPVFVLIFAYKKDTCQNMSVPLLALRPCISVGLPLNNFYFYQKQNTIKFFIRQYCWIENLCILRMPACIVSYRSARQTTHHKIIYYNFTGCTTNSFTFFLSNCLLK